MKINGEGSILPLEDKSAGKCTKWRLQVSVGRDLGTGKYKRASRNFRGSKSEAKKALREFITDLEGICGRASDRITYKEYSSYWLDVVKSKVTANTYDYYMRAIKTGMIHFKEARLDEITPRQIEEVYRKLQSGQTLSGKPSSGKTIHGFAIAHSAMYKEAIKDELISYNPFQIADAPSIQTKERKVIPYERLAELADSLDPKNATQFAILLIIRTGLRRGEAAALDVKHFDFEEKTLTVNCSCDSHKIISSPKTEAGIRVLPLPAKVEEDVKERIKAIKDTYSSIAKKTGVKLKVNKNTPLICNSLGERQNPTAIRRWWERNRDALGFSDITIHDLRHSYLTAMARKKVDPKVLQKLAGHAKYTTTMQIYVHADDEDMRKAVDLVDW